VAVRRELGAGLENLDGTDVGERENPCGSVRRLAHLPDAGMCQWTAHEGNILNAGHLHVRDEHPVTVKMAGILLAQEACADPALRSHSFIHLHVP
jgi:hypothetical protein